MRIFHISFNVSGPKKILWILLTFETIKSKIEGWQTDYRVIIFVESQMAEVIWKGQPLVVSQGVGSVHRALCTVRWALCTIHWSLCTVISALSTVHWAMCTIHCSLCTEHWVQCTVISAQCIVHSKQLTVHSTKHFIWYFAIFSSFTKENEAKPNELKKRE